MPDRDPSVPDLLARLRQVDTTSLVDAGRALGVLPPEIVALRPGSRLVGRAVVAGSREDLVPVLVALRSAGPGDVLVLSGAPGRALAGELFGTEALRRGLAGLVIDGSCRDSGQLRSMDLPVFARGVRPRAYGASVLPPADGPVQIGDVLVSTGDLVVADDDGVVVGSPAELADAIDGAEAIQARERALREAIERGESLFDHLNLDEHLAALRDGRDSGLAFS